MLKKLLITTTLFLMAGFLPLSTVFAQQSNQGITVNPNDDPRCEDTQFREDNPDICINIDGFIFPTFVSFEVIQNFTVFSYIVFAFNILFLGLVIFWIFIVIKAGIEYINSQGDSDKMQKSNQQISNIFTSITILIIGFVVVVIVAGIFGFGNFLDWPRVLSQCEDGTLYITKTLELEAENSSSDPISEDEIVAACFG